MNQLNFKISEFLDSNIAKENGIKNIPSDPIVFDNILTLIIKCLQPIRDYVRKPIVITSGYRCPIVNKKAGGEDNSQHLTGCAADFVILGLTIDEAIQKIKTSGIEYDQLIHEGNWVHISYVYAGNRKMYIKY